VLCLQENFAETMRQLSAAWRTMSEQEKDRYRVAAARQSSSGASRRSHSSHSRSASGSRHRRSSSVSTLYYSFNNKNYSNKSSAGSGGSRKRYLGGPGGPSSFWRQQRLSEITIEPIKNLGGLGNFFAAAGGTAPRPCAPRP